MPITQANTWPPLISSNSQDDLNQQQLYGTGVLTSCMVVPENNDEFFYPVELGLSGFSYQGTLHQNGGEVPGAPKASWYTEEAGPYRGQGAGFPSRALILVTDAGLTILDLTDSAYTLWMHFLRGDVFALTHNYAGGIQGCVPTEVTYHNGRVLLRMDPDPGARDQYPVFLVIDLVADRIYLESSTPSYAEGMVEFGFTFTNPGPPD